MNDAPAEQVPGEMAARLAVFDEAVDGLRDSARYARLSGDPAAHSLAAMVTVMESVAIGFRTREVERMQLSESLRQDAETVAKLAVAQVEARAAGVVETLAPRLAQLVERAVTGRLWLVKLRTVLLAGGIAFALALGVFALSYAAGYASGRNDGLITGKIVTAAMTQGPDAALAWSRLMVANDPVAALRSCKAEHDSAGRRYCQMPVWLDPQGGPPIPR